MKKFLLLSFMLLFVGVSKISAVKTIGTEFSSVSALNGKVFAIVNKADGKAICNKKKNYDYDLQYLSYADAFSAENYGYMFKIESTDGGYLIKCVKPDGNVDSHNTSPYFQSNKLETENGVCFFFNLNFGGKNRGLDGDGYAVWVIDYDSEHAAFTLKNVGTDKYYNNPTQSANSDTPGYFTFCEIEELTTSVSISNAASISETVENNPANFIEIAQENVETGFTAADKVVGTEYTTYTTKDGDAGNLNIAIKTLDIDVTGCDYVIIKFAEAIEKNGWKVAFWGNNQTQNVTAGSTEYKLVFANDPKPEGASAVNNNILKEITLMTLWDKGPITAKVKGVYKHLAQNTARTYSFNQALDFTGVEGLKAYAITAFNAGTGTLTLTQVNQVPANTGLYLVGKGGDYNIPVIDNADPIVGNLLKPSEDADLEPTSGDYTNLVLAKVGGVINFHPLSGAGNIGTNKAYLQLPTADYNSMPASAALRLVFEGEDEVTAITGVNDVKIANGAWFTLTGVKLNAMPTQKGVYINNGRKVAIK